MRYVAMLCVLLGVGCSCSIHLDPKRIVCTENGAEVLSVTGQLWAGSSPHISTDDGRFIIPAVTWTCTESAK